MSGFWWKLLNTPTRGEMRRMEIREMRRANDIREREFQRAGDQMTTEAGRLALRVEGEWWVAHYALPHTMDNAIELGRIRMGPVRQNKAHKQAFMTLMQDIVGEYLEGITGGPVDWPEPVPAPESERSGSA